MIETISEFFKGLTGGNDYLMLYLMSIIPVIELRGAIVFMSGMFTQSASRFLECYIGMWCCIAGSTTVILPLILITKPLIKALKRTKWFSKLAKNLEANLAQRAEEAYNEDKDGKVTRRLSSDAKKFLGLFVFVAVPLPMTGAWTGACIGSFLDFPIWKASLAVFLGNIVAGHILMAIAYFMPQQYADLFLYGFVLLAVAIAVTLYFTRAKRQERKRKEEMAKYASKSDYELAVLKKEAEENGELLIKKEYVDENGDKHIIIGRDEKKNRDAIDDKSVI